MNFMNNVQKMSLTAVLALAIIISCSEYPEKNFDELAKGLNYEYCMFKESSMCLKGLYAECPQGGSLRSKCPYPQAPSDKPEYKHCVFMEDGVCFNGPFTECPDPAILSNDCLTEYTYCIFAEDRMCLEGPYMACAGGGMLSNNCPYAQSASSNAPLYNYCVFEEEEMCLEGPHTVCPTGGTARDNCPYISSSSSEEPSSSSSEISSSSSVEESSSSSEDSSSSVEESSSSSEQSSSSATPMCGTKEYDPETEECENDVIWRDCNGRPYNTTIHFCFGGIRRELCGGSDYDYDNEFCTGNEVKAKCGGEEFDPQKGEVCSFNKLYVECGGSPRELAATHFCLGDVTTEKCGGAGGLEFTEDEFCNTNTGVVHAYCGSVRQDYDISIEGCCNEEVFTRATQFCQIQENGISEKKETLCGDKPFDFNQECWKNNAITGTFVDSRDQITYKYTIIGDQKWMAQNLNYSGDEGTIGSCTTDNCETYGRFYDWVTAMNIDIYYNSNTYGILTTRNYQGICPEGWHVPQGHDFERLLETASSSRGSGYGFINYVGAGEKLKSVSANGIDYYGFSALAGGYMTGSSSYGLDAGYFVSATEFESYLKLSVSGNNADLKYGQYGGDVLNNKSTKLSLRCVED